jgi:hypothetical protein
VPVGRVLIEPNTSLSDGVPEGRRQPRSCAAALWTALSGGLSPASALTGLSIAQTFSSPSSQEPGTRLEGRAFGLDQPNGLARH